jgi:hypothetical protein
MATNVPRDLIAEIDRAPTPNRLAELRAAAARLEAELPRPVGAADLLAAAAADERARLVALIDDLRTRRER